VRVLHCEHQRSWSGQTARVLDDCRELRRSGVDVRIVCAGGSRLEQRARADGFETFPIHLVYRYRPIRALRRAIRAFKPDLIHAHGSRNHTCALIAKGLTRTVVVRTKHNLNALRSGIFSRLVYARLTDRLVAVCDAVKEALVRDGIAREHVSVVPGGIDLHRFGARPRVSGERASLGLAEDGVLIGFIGRLALSKGSAVLFEAIPKIVAQRPDVRFVCVGAGDTWPAHLAEEAQAPIRGNVKLTGFVEDVRPYLHAVDAVILPSFKEGLSTTVLEAMASGKPVLGTSVGGTLELVVPGQTGELFAPGAPDALARTVLDFAARPERWAAYGERGRERVLRYDVRHLGPRLIAAYEQALAARGRRAAVLTGTAT
jgi:glycosyltransferase involved in cell wall biosynthesis